MYSFLAGLVGPSLRLAILFNDDGIELLDHIQAALKLELAGDHVENRVCSSLRNVVKQLLRHEERCIWLDAAKCIVALGAPIGPQLSVETLFLLIAQIREIFFDEADARLVGEVVPHVDDHADVLLRVANTGDLIAEDAVHFLLQMLAKHLHLFVHDFVKLDNICAGINIFQKFAVAIYLVIDNGPLFFLEFGAIFLRALKTEPFRLGISLVGGELLLFELTNLLCVCKIDRHNILIE